MRTFFEDFTTDAGRAVTVEWGWNSRHECVEVVSVWDTETEADVELSGSENERLDAMVMALDPFPPHEDWEG